MYVFTDSTLRYLLKKIKSKIALKSELDNKVDKVDGKGLSDNDFTDSAKSLLETKFNSVEASYSTGMTHIVFKNSNKVEKTWTLTNLQTGDNEGLDLGSIENFISYTCSDHNKVITFEDFDIMDGYYRYGDEDCESAPVIYLRNGKVIIDFLNPTNSECEFTIKYFGYEETVLDLKTGCDMFFYPTIDAELLADLEGNVTIPYAFISKSGNDIGKVTVKIENLTNNTSSENIFNVTDNGSELVLEGASSGNANVSFTIEGSTDEIKANVLGEYSTVIMLPLTVYRSTDSSLVPVNADVSNISNIKTVVSDFGNNEYEIMLYTTTKTNAFVFYNQPTLTNISYISDNITSMALACFNCTNLTGSPICGPKVTDMSLAYANCYNLTGNPVCGPNVTGMASVYHNCFNLTGSPICGPNVTKMSYAYGNCYNLTGSPVCGPNVTDMSDTYYNCRKLTGSPVCGDNVITMNDTYMYCTNLTGNPVCGPNVTRMDYAYYYCQNLTGAPVCGPNVTNMSKAYAYCTNLTGNPVCGPNVTNMIQTYCNCKSLGHNGYFFSNKISNAYGCFAGRNIQNRLNLYVPNAGPNSTYNTLKWCLVSNTHSLLANNVSWTDDMASNECYYNTAYNIYIYPVGNVSQVYKDNELLVARYTMSSGANVVPEGTIENIREVKVTSENDTPQFSLGTLGVDITSMKEITTSVGDFYYIDDYTDAFGYVQYRYGTPDKDRIYLSVDSDTKNVFIENMFDSNNNALEEAIFYIPGPIDMTTMTTTEDKSNDDGTVTRSVYLDESQAGKLPSSISFNGATNLLTVEKLKVDNITDTSYMFNGCSNLTSVCAMDWDTSKIIKADYMFAGCSKLTKKSFESSYVYDLKYESDTYILNFNKEIKLFDYPSSEFNFITLNYPMTEFEEGHPNFDPKIERSDMYGCTYYTFGNMEPIVITVYDDGSIYAYTDGPGGDNKLYLYNKHKDTFELPNVESASHIFDGCTNLL